MASGLSPGAKRSVNKRKHMKERDVIRTLRQRLAPLMNREKENKPTRVPLWMTAALVLGVWAVALALLVLAGGVAR